MLHHWINQPVCKAVTVTGNALADCGNFIGTQQRGKPAGAECAVAASMSDEGTQ
jgi:hypothetical protein